MPTHRATHRPHAGRTSPPRRRAIPDIFGNDLQSERLYRLLEEDPDPALRLYVYRLAHGRTLKPALISAAPFPGLLNYLRDQHAGGRFYIIIRRGRRMELSGGVAVIRPTLTGCA